MASSEHEISDFCDISLNPSVTKEESLLPGGRGSADMGTSSWGQVKNFFTHSSDYPKTVFLILWTEFCERFNYYGMRTILVIYLTEWLELPYYTGVSVYHFFSMLAYFSPILGAIIADGYLGRYKTIFYISILYAIGTLILSLTAFPPPEIYGPVIGLLLISIGTGGIKPCVSAFGGDQFSSHQENERLSFFSTFYFMINLGSTLSTFITPILRADVHCYRNACYPLAFGVPTILMILSIVIFVCGRKHYKQIPPTGNLVGRVSRCVWHGLKLRIRNGKNEERDHHWLNHATDTFEEDFVEDVKSLLKVLFLFLPLPIFWALFNQQGSRWTLQAVEMNGEVGSLGRIKPDQMQVLNPLLILILIPVFDKLVYPCLTKIHIPNRPLQRMSAGMALSCLAFIVAGCVQLKMDSAKDPHLDGNSAVTFINTANCPVSIKSSFYIATVPAHEASSYILFSPGNYTLSINCEPSGKPTQLLLTTEKHIAYRAIIKVDASDSDRLTILQFEDKRKKDMDGKAIVSLIANFPVEANTTVIFSQQKNNVSIIPGSLNISLHDDGDSDFTSVEPGHYQLFVFHKTASSSELVPVEPVLSFGGGSVQTIVLLPEETKTNLPTQVSALIFTSVRENDLTMAWMIPQYVLITIGEILFSITGLSFAYSQAPPSMKSVLQAAWLLTVAFGDLVVIIVAETQIMPTQSSEFFMFAGLMALDTLLFIVMAYFYKNGSSSRALDMEADTVTLVKSDPLTKEFSDAKKD
ncbi:solute carrier family 15 member 2-like isoform X2 [Physella acuta]|uniref:solute carrier family 15 member 2-like isoform X2 n=1 Tax=Physella acuta TaxID=109671 RepID=UPI0027DCCFE1|nr:solute carrier family 15 member 2-like isoform X2 [Physella acuta]XP_059162045.1 solute carrier family 15 member 2-like isoform X2 [Physella acuta]